MAIPVAQPTSTPEQRDNDLPHDDVAASTPPYRRKTVAQRVRRRALKLTSPLLLSASLYACSGSLASPGEERDESREAAHADAGAGTGADDGGSDPRDSVVPQTPGEPPMTPPPDEPPDSPPNAPGASTPPPPLGEESGPGAIEEGSGPAGADTVCETAEPGVAPLMRLSTRQYHNTVLDLLEQSGLAELRDEVSNALSAIPADSLGDSFRGLDGRMSLEHVEGYFKAGQAVGDALLQTPGALESLAGACALEAVLSAACAEDFLSAFLGLAFRRPIGPSELDSFMELNDPALSPGESIRQMIIVALSAPRFINLVEVDGTASQTSPNLLLLTTWEIASRLSYTFWETMPDAELRAAAADGTLATPEGLGTQLRRIWNHPRTETTLWNFWNEWLRFEKFTGFEHTRPAFQALAAGTQIGQNGHDYYADMVSEIRDLTRHFTFDEPAPLATLLSTRISVTQSEDLASLYGVPVYDGVGDFPLFPEGDRAGLLQRAGLLVSNLEQTNPFHRGSIVRRAVLCDDLPQPDPNSLPPGSLDPPPLDEAQSTRQRFEAKVAGNGLCEGCHAIFSDIGYVLEAYDALGRRRSVEQVFDEQTGTLLAELPIDSEAPARITADDMSLVMGPEDLNQRIIDSGKVEQCLAEKYFGYAMRRQPETQSADGCVVEELGRIVGESDRGLADAFMALAQYSSFFQRTVGPR